MTSSLALRSFPWPCSCPCRRLLEGFVSGSTLMISFSRWGPFPFFSVVLGGGNSKLSLSLSLSLDECSLSDELLDECLDPGADRSSWADFGVAMPVSTDSLLAVLPLSEPDIDTDLDLVLASDSELDSDLELDPDVDADLDRVCELRCWWCLL